MKDIIQKLTSKNNKPDFLRSAICMAVGIGLLCWPGALLPSVVAKLIGIGLLVLGVVNLIALMGLVQTVGLGYITLGVAIVVTMFGVTLLLSDTGSRLVGYTAGIILVIAGASGILRCIRGMKGGSGAQSRPSTDGSGLNVSSDGISSAREVDYRKEQQ